MVNIQGLLDKYKKIEGERFFADIFDRQEYSVILDKPAKVIVDVGALAGEFGAYVYDRVDVIYAIEPYKPYYDELVANIEEFGLEKIKPFNCAIGGYDGVGKLAKDPFRGGNFLTSDNDKYDEVVVKTLDTFFTEQGITDVDILKIDVEGAEREIFGASAIFALASVKLIVGEHLGGLEPFFEQQGFTKHITPDNPNCIFERIPLPI